MMLLPTFFTIHHGPLLVMCFDVLLMMCFVCCYEQEEARARAGRWIASTLSKGSYICCRPSKQKRLISHTLRHRPNIMYNYVKLGPTFGSHCPAAFSKRWLQLSQSIILLIGQVLASFFQLVVIIHIKLKGNSNATVPLCSCMTNKLSSCIVVLIEVFLFSLQGHPGKEGPHGEKGGLVRDMLFQPFV